MFRRPRPAALRALPAAALAALLAACGGDAGKITEPVTSKVLGTFSGAVAGGVTRSITGIALYGQLSGNEPGATSLQIGMGSLKADKSFADLVVISRGKRDLPAAGTYAFHDADADEDAAPEAFSIVAVLGQPNGGMLLCTGTGGTLTVQSASGGRVKGGYTAPASCLDASAAGDAAGGAVAVTLTGTFDAVDAPEVSLPNVSRAPAAIR